MPIDLVKIRVYHGKDRPPLADITKKANLQRNTEKGKGCRKLKRVESRKEVTLGIVDISKFHAGAGGIKRSWSLRDEVGEGNLNPEEKEKRLQSELHDCSAKNEIGVASLEWHQFHQ